jgi:hypothetical protein
MWSAIIEKAWAKLKGSYTRAWNGYNVNGLRTITGAPVFTYKIAELEGTAHESWELLKAA